MESALKKLLEMMPPPEKPRFCNVDWARLEKFVGLSYPTHFKAFIDQYGGSVWCDHVCPFFSEANSDEQAKEFVASVMTKLSYLKGNTYDTNFVAIDLPLYPTENGLFPFLIDYSGNLFCWHRDSDNSDRWPVVRWQMGPITIMKDMTIAKLLLDWLQRTPQMIEV